MTIRSLRIRYSSSSNSRWVELDRALAARHLVRVGVQRQVADAQRRRAARRAAAQQRAHAREQLLALERLDEVVVGARRPGPRRATRAASRAVRIRIGTSSSARSARATSTPSILRQAEVEDHEVGGERAALLERRRAVGGGAHLVALHAQRALEGLGDVLVVLDDEDAWGAGEVVHGSLCIAAACKAMVRPRGRLRAAGVEVARDGPRPARRSPRRAPRTARASARKRAPARRARRTRIRAAPPIAASPRGLPRAAPCSDQRAARRARPRAAGLRACSSASCSTAAGTAGRAGHALAVGARLDARARARARAASRCVARRRRAAAAPGARPRMRPLRAGALCLFAAVTLALAAGTLGHQLRPRQRDAHAWTSAHLQSHGGVVGEALYRARRTGSCRASAWTSSSCSCCSPATILLTGSSLGRLLRDRRQALRGHAAGAPACTTASLARRGARAGRGRGQRPSRSTSPTTDASAAGPPRSTHAVGDRVVADHLGRGAVGGSEPPTRTPRAGMRTELRRSTPRRERPQEDGSEDDDALGATFTPGEPAETGEDADPAGPLPRRRSPTTRNSCGSCPTRGRC